MVHGILSALFGLFAGLVARALLPGEPAGGLVTTLILGSLGGWLAALAGEKLGLYQAPQKISFVMSMLGAMALMLIYSLVPH